MDVYSSDWYFPMLLQSVTYNEKKKTVTYLEIHKVHLTQQEPVGEMQLKPNQRQFLFFNQDHLLLCVIAAIKPVTICLMRL